VDAAVQCRSGGHGPCENATGENKCQMFHGFNLSRGCSR
jgi:hypothetical protein